MDDKLRQLLILFSVMVFLTAITVFWVEVSETENTDQGVNASNLPQNSTDISMKLEKREGDDLLTQSINGLIQLYRDFNTGLNTVTDDSD